MWHALYPEPNGPSLASHEDPESVLAPSLLGASARLCVRRALPFSGAPAAAPAARRATCRLACSMLHAGPQPLVPALLSSAERSSVRLLPSPWKDESFRRVSPMLRERGGLGSTTFGGGEKCSDRPGLAP